MRKIILITLLCALVVFGCKDEPPADDPKTQTTIITTSFGDITVTGTFTNAEWNGVPDKFTTAFNTAYTQVGDTVQNTVSAKSVTVIVEKNPTYTNYSTTRNGNTIHINFAIVNNSDALFNAIGASCALLAGVTQVQEQG